MAVTQLTKEEVRKWLHRIKIAEAWRSDEEDEWERFLGYLEGRVKKVEGDEISVNLVHPMVRIIIPSIYSKNPDVMVVPRRKKWTETADTMKLWLNYLMREIGLKEEVKLCILDALIMGIAWMKAGYQTDFEAPEERGKPLIRRYMDRLIGSGRKKKRKTTFSLEPNERIVGERPWALRCSPFDIIVPALSRRPDSLPWIAERFTYELSDAKEKFGIEDLRPTTDIWKVMEDRGADKKSLKSEAVDEDLQYITYYEIWDGRTGEVYVVSEGHDEGLDRKDNVYDFLDSRFPYFQLRFNEVPDKFYPMSDIKPWEEQLMELNATRTQMVRHRKRYNRRYIYREGDYTPDNIEKLKAGHDGTTVPSGAENLRDSFLPIEDAALPPEVYAVEARIKDDITNISGITDYQRGSLMQGAKTATEASIVESQSRTRISERLDVVSGFVNQIATALGQISQAFLDPDQIWPVLGEDAVYWVKIDDRDAIRGEFLYEVVFGSTAQINKEVDRQQYIQLYQMIAQDPYFNPVKVRLELLRKFDQKDPEEWMMPNIAEMLLMQRVNDIITSMQPGAEEGGGPSGPRGEGVEGPEPQEGVTSPASLSRGIRRRMRTPKPGGPGGGRPE